MAELLRFHPLVADDLEAGANWYDNIIWRSNAPPLWAIKTGKQRRRRFACSEKPNDPQDKPAGFGMREYGFWWPSVLLQPTRGWWKAPTHR